MALHGHDCALRPLAPKAASRVANWLHSSRSTPLHGLSTEWEFGELSGWVGCMSELDRLHLYTTTAHLHDNSLCTTDSTIGCYRTSDLGQVGRPRYRPLPLILSAQYDLASASLMMKEKIKFKVRGP